MNLFRKYKRTSTNKDLVVYNSLLYLLISENETEKVDKIYEDLINERVIPDQTTFNTIIKGACKNKDVDFAIKYFNKMKESNISPNRISYNFLMDLAVKI